MRGFDPDEEAPDTRIDRYGHQIRNVKADLGLSAKKINLELSFNAEMTSLWMIIIKIGPRA